MNNKSQSIRVGLFFLLGLALAWITFESLNGGRLFKKPGYTLVAGFANLKGLKSGDEIRMAGVKVGAVQLTRLAGHRVEALLAIEPGVKIPSDAVASVEQSSLLGSNYLGVTFGTPGVELLKDGDEISTKATVDMSEVISQLGNLGSKLEQVVGEIGKSMGAGSDGGGIFQRLDKLVTDNGPKLTATISNLQDITTKIKTSEGTLGKLINEPKLHDDLLASVTEIKAAAADARTFMGDAKHIVADVKGRQGHPRSAPLRRAHQQQPESLAQQPARGIRQAEQRPGHHRQADRRRQPLPEPANHDEESRPRPRRPGRPRPHHRRRRRGRRAVLNRLGRPLRSTGSEPQVCRGACRPPTVARVSDP
jgi:phospholipid/cholesterol/gamma-HCH transport system substrate-binding protein